jgi:arginyl-tRNA synthetase
MKGAVASRGSVLLGGLQHAHNIELADAAASFIAFERLHRTLHDGFDLCRRHVRVEKKELDEIKRDLGRFRVGFDVWYSETSLYERLENLTDTSDSICPIFNYTQI